MLSARSPATSVEPRQAIGPASVRLATNLGKPLSRPVNGISPEPSASGWRDLIGPPPEEQRVHAPPCSTLCGGRAGSPGGVGAAWPLASLRVTDETATREAWFLQADERGNPHTDIDRRRVGGQAWTEGNLVTPLVDGAEYFARRRVDVRGLVWRSHPDEVRLSEQEALHLAEIVNEAGGELLLDERVRRGGSHHQKLVLVRHLGHEADDVAFVGGIDLCHGRRDDGRHLGDPQAIELDRRYGDRPPWHDVHVELRGPAIGDVSHTFRERWDDPTPLDHRNPWRAAMARVAREPRRPKPLPPPPPDPGTAGPHPRQVLRA